MNEPSVNEPVDPYITTLEKQIGALADRVRELEDERMRVRHILNARYNEATVAALVRMMREYNKLAKE